MPHQLVIRGGQVVDGLGGEPAYADVAVDDGTITTVGKVDAKGQREFDAEGMTVTPGFIDLHTHLDAQICWDPHVSPVSCHGVTTALIGNCGVDLRALPARGPRTPRRHDGDRGGHPPPVDPHRLAMGLGGLRRLPGLRRPAQSRHQHRGHDRPRRTALLRDGRARRRRGRDGRRKTRDGAIGRRGHRPRRRGLLVQPLQRPPHPRRARGAGNARRTRRTGADRQRGRLPRCALPARRHALRPRRPRGRRHRRAHALQLHAAGLRRRRRPQASASDPQDRHRT